MNPEKIIKEEIEHPRKQWYLSRKEYYQKNKEKILAYYWKHREELLAQSHKKNLQIKKQLFVRLGDKCVKCGFSDIRALQIDHINGGGNKELKKPEFRYEKYYPHLLSLPLEELKSKYQLLCANCNWIKRAENNEYKGKGVKNV